MFRRRDSRAPLYRAGLLGPRLRRTLRRAHHLLETGEHGNAAVLFDELALHARDRNLIEIAPFLFLQGGRAHLLAGQAQAGERDLWEGLDLLAGSQRWGILRRLGDR